MSVTGFLAYLEVERRVSAHTLDAYRRDLAALTEWAQAHGITELADVQSEALRGFVAAEHRRGLSPKSLQRRLSACRSFYQWLLKHLSIPDQAIISESGRKVALSKVCSS